MSKLSPPHPRLPETLQAVHPPQYKFQRHTRLFPRNIVSRKVCFPSCKVEPLTQRRVFVAHEGQSLRGRWKAEGTSSSLRWEAAHGAWKIQWPDGPGHTCPRGRGWRTPPLGANPPICFPSSVLTEHLFASKFPRIFPSPFKILSYIGPQKSDNKRPKNDIRKKEHFLLLFGFIIALV